MYHIPINFWMGGGYEIGGLKNILESLFSVYSGNYWFISCYVVLYAVHPFLNQITSNSSKESILAIICAGFLYYSVLGMVKLPYSFSKIGGFILIYLIVAYIKRYNSRIVNNLKLNVVIVMVANVLFMLLLLLSNWLQLKGGSIYWLSIWAVWSNAFFVTFAVSSVFLFAKVNLKSRLIAELSGMSFLIYAISENVLLRKIVKPAYWFYIYNKYTYNHLLLWFAMTSLILFIVSAVVAWIYKKTIQRPVYTFANAVERVILYIWNRFLSKI